MNDHYTVLHVDSQALFRDGIKCLLRQTADFSVIGDTGNGREAISLARSLKPSVLLADSMLDNTSVFDLVKGVLQIMPEVTVAFLSNRVSDLVLREAAKIGVRGFFLKSEPSPVFVDCLRKMMRFNRFTVPESMVDRVLKISSDMLSGRLKQPSPREFEIIRLYAEGKGTREISEILGISVKTVETHRSHIKDKFDIKGQIACLRYCQEVDMVKGREVA